MSRFEIFPLSVWAAYIISILESVTIESYLIIQSNPDHTATYV